MEAAQTEMSLIPNGKSHDPEEEADEPLKSLLEEDQWVSTANFTHCCVLPAEPVPFGFAR